MTDRTAIELARDGTRTVFHRRANRAWTHPKGEPVMADGSQRFDCPECIPVAERSEPTSTRTEPCEHGHPPTHWRIRKSGKGYCRLCNQASRKAS